MAWIAAIATFLVTLLVIMGGGCAIAERYDPKGFYSYWEHGEDNRDIEFSRGGGCLAAIACLAGLILAGWAAATVYGMIAP